MGQGVLRVFLRSDGYSERIRELTGKQPCP
jgi:hypothetical protein